MVHFDIDRHNEEVSEVWRSYNAGQPVRVPVILGLNARSFLLDSRLNKHGVTFETYSNDPDTMAAVQLDLHHWVRHHLLQDAEMGLPKEGWTVSVDFQNYYEAAWFGAEVHYRKGQVPDTMPFLTDDKKRMLFDRGLPDPFEDHIMAKNVWFYEHIRNNMSRYVHSDLPVVGVHPSGMGTDGPFTVACDIRGATQLCIDLYEDPDYVKDLLEYITAATIHRITCYRKRFAGTTERPQSLSFADDSIELLSPETYREFVLPFHRRLVEELSKGGPNAIHLCGNATRHFRTIRDELNVTTFDTGYPVDFGSLREELGPDVQINGGPRVALLLSGTSCDVSAEVKRILESGVTRGGRFVLREANNLSPGTPEENVAAMYEAAIRYGTYG